MSDTPSQPQTDAHKLAARTVETIKKAQEIMTEQESVIKQAQDSLSKYAADDQGAAPIVDEILAKLSTHKIEGDYLVPPEELARFKTAMQTREGIASITEQLVDRLITTAANSDKSAYDLGEAASEDETRRVDRAKLSGFASLPSTLRF